MSTGWMIVWGFLAMPSNWGHDGRSIHSIQVHVIQGREHPFAELTFRLSSRQDYHQALDIEDRQAEELEQELRDGVQRWGGRPAKLRWPAACEPSRPTTPRRWLCPDWARATSNG
jgi:hypothetical protein